MKLTQNTVWIGIGLTSLLTVGAISMVTGGSQRVVTDSASATTESSVSEAPVSEKAEPSIEVEKPVVRQEAPVSSARKIDPKKVRFVMATTKNCKGICSEVPAYVNARINADELVQSLPNGRKVMMLESVGEWSHVAIFTPGGTELTGKTAWTFTVWLVEAK